MPSTGTAAGYTAAHSRVSTEEDRLTARIIELATRYGRYEYRRITALLSQESWRVKSPPYPLLQEESFRMNPTRGEGTKAKLARFAEGS